MSAEILLFTVTVFGKCFRIVHGCEIDVAIFVIPVSVIAERKVLKVCKLVLVGRCPQLS